MRWILWSRWLTNLNFTDKMMRPLHTPPAEIWPSATYSSVEVNCCILVEEYKNAANELSMLRQVLGKFEVRRWGFFFLPLSGTFYGVRHLTFHSSGSKHHFAAFLLTLQPCWRTVAIHQGCRASSIWTIPSRTAFDENFSSFISETTLEVSVASKTCLLLTRVFCFFCVNNVLIPNAPNPFYLV